MSGRKLLLDSNIIIYIAQQQLDIDAFFLQDDRLFYSDITLMETMGYPFMEEKEAQETELFLSIPIRIPIDEAVVQKVISLRRTQKIKLPDAIIAATAIVHSCLLVTRNTADFLKISDLNLIDPFK